MNHPMKITPDQIGGWQRGLPPADYEDTFQLQSDLLKDEEFNADGIVTAWYENGQLLTDDLDEPDQPLPSFEEPGAAEVYWRPNSSPTNPAPHEVRWAQQLNEYMTLLAEFADFDGSLPQVRERSRRLLKSHGIEI